MMMGRRALLQRLVSGLLMAVLCMAAGCSWPARTTEGPSAVTPAPTPVPAPLIFGTNLALYDTTDQVVNNEATQRLLQSMSVPIFRIPFRHSLSDEYELQALQAVERMGAIPLVIIHGPTDPNALADDRHAIALVQSVFGAGPVYVEFGNEADLAGVTVQRYIDAWNAVIPDLKAMAPTYRFVGPVNFQPDPTYIATFDRFANPRPDANSWHEYACEPSSPDEYCMTRIDDWSKHIRQIDAAVRAAIGAPLPLMITEWNLDAQPDPRYSDTAFMRTWTAHALQTLAANQSQGLFAAMQYCVTNNRAMNLIDSANSLTPEGQAFFQALTRAAMKSASPPASG